MFRYSVLSMTWRYEDLPEVQRHMIFVESLQAQHANTVVEVTHILYAQDSRTAWGYARRPQAWCARALVESLAFPVCVRYSAYPIEHSHVTNRLRTNKSDFSREHGECGYCISFLKYQDAFLIAGGNSFSCNRGGQEQASGKAIWGLS
jgi:hypothetical protein